MRTAYDVGLIEHPQIEIRKVFPDASDFLPESIGDCWFFEATPREPVPKCFVPISEWSVDSRPARGGQEGAQLEFERICKRDPQWDHELTHNGKVVVTYTGRKP